MIARLGLTAINDLRDALPRLTHVPLAHLPQLDIERRRDYWLDEISKSLADESSIAFAWVASGRIGGFIIYTDSLWDSRIIGRRIGTVKHLAVTSDDPAGVGILRELINELTHSLADRGTECVACRVQSSELATIHALEQSGFLLMDTLLDFVFAFSQTGAEETNFRPRDQRLRIRRAEARDLPVLMAMNERAFANYFGRYHADPQIPSGTATRIYAEWMRSAFEGWADWIPVGEIDGKIAGSAIWRRTLAAKDKNSPGVAYCDMVVVDPEFQGSGLGTALMRYGMDVARDIAQYVVGPVHICNYSIQRTLQKVGWKIFGARHSFHKWLKPDDLLNAK
jgi:dTDP-4-amino-4,6-dideoxy-D-galactose acyltransferase